MYVKSSAHESIIPRVLFPRLGLTSELSFTYNNLMPRFTDKTELQNRIREIELFYRKNGRMPSYAEIGDLLGFSSKNAVSKLVEKLEKLNVIIRDKTGKLIPKSIAMPVKVLGTVEAGFPSPAEEELVDNISFDDLLIQNREATFLLKVSGDSMTGAGIMEGDMVIVDKGLTPKSGDIVIAQVDGEWTMKYLRKRGENVTLIPANPKYQPIKPKNELKIAGVVTAVVRKYK
jgi:SOS regulatory protein LexA